MRGKCGQRLRYNAGVVGMVSRASLAVLVVIALVGSARADTLGVVVEGPNGEGGPLRVRIEAWATEHDHKLVALPLSVDGAKTLANCLVLDDRKCAAAVVDRRGKAEHVVYARIDATTISLFWFQKHHGAVAQKLACQPCSDDLLAEVLGKLEERSDATTRKEIAADPEPEGAAPAPAPEAAASGRPRWPLYTLGGGAALVTTGIILYATSESPTGAKPTYLNDRPLGTGLAIAGALAIGVGGYFWLSHKDSGPTVTATSGGAVAGWALVF